MCIVGTTTGPARIEVAKALENYWKACDFKIVETREGGWLVRRPDFVVVQISLLAYRSKKLMLNRISKWFENSKVETVSDKSNALVAELKRLSSTKDPMESKLFLNVWGGSKDDEELKTVMAELSQMGVRAQVGLGPLLMKTVGKADGDSILLPMPILTASTYHFMHRVTKKAYDGLVADGGDADMVFGKGRDAPKFGHHMWRRLADGAAEAKLARKECTEQDVELHFGWRLAKYKKKMRLHYSNRGERTARARITEDI